MRARRGRQKRGPDIAPRQEGKPTMKRISRRNLLTQSARLAGAAMVGLPLAEVSSGAVQGEAAAPKRKLKVIVAGAHPDDPESGCGGTIARYTGLGHDVVVFYLTRGEAGIRGKSHDEAAAIRTAEAKKACEILKARPVFVGQIDGSAEINPGRYAEFARMLEVESPDIVYTHWPVDTHRDHRATSLLVFDAWLNAGKKFALYYFEVMSGEQTSQFWPTHYVDITATEKLKRAACFAHVSQDPDDFYQYHDAMNRFRGMEAGHKYAEGFVRHAQSADDSLPLAL
jgi:LmbE family N-acetylglucosaminyl deacetylase